jgi:hypothetical protein
LEIIIKGSGDLSDPKARILAIEAATQAICEKVGQDPADGTMMLLTAAVHIAMKHSGKKPIQDIAPVLAVCLGDAIVTADDFFKLRVA